MRHHSWALVCAIAGVPSVAVRTTAAAPSAMMDFVNIVVSWLLRALSTMRAAILVARAGPVNQPEVPMHDHRRGARMQRKCPPEAACASLRASRDNDASVLILTYAGARGAHSLGRRECPISVPAPPVPTPDR